MRKRGISEGGALGCGDVTPPALEGRGCHKPGHPPPPPVPAETLLGPHTPTGDSIGWGLGAGAMPQEGGDQAVGSSLSACQWGSP